MSVRTVDGFPINSFNFLPDIIEPPINQWSQGKVIKIDVDDGLYRPTIKVVEWKDKKTTVYDYELFVGLIQDWMKREKWSKNKALDEFFEMI